MRGTGHAQQEEEKWVGFNNANKARPCEPAGVDGQCGQPGAGSRRDGGFRVPGARTESQSLVSRGICCRVGHVSAVSQRLRDDRGSRSWIRCSCGKAGGKQYGFPCLLLCESVANIRTCVSVYSHLSVCSHACVCMQAMLSYARLHEYVTLTHACTHSRAHTRAHTCERALSQTHSGGRYCDGHQWRPRVGQGTSVSQKSCAWCRRHRLQCGQFLQTSVHLHHHALFHPRAPRPQL